MELTPQNLSDKKMKMAIEYEKLGNRLAELKEKKAYKIMEFIGEGNNNALSERKWNATEEGIEEMKISIKMKGIEKLISATNSKLDVMNREAMNHY